MTRECMDQLLPEGWTDGLYAAEFTMDDKRFKFAPGNRNHVWLQVYRDEKWVNLRPALLSDVATLRGGTIENEGILRPMPETNRAGGSAPERP